MVFHDEVVPADALDDLDAAREQEGNEREIGMAMQLIDSLSTSFEPQRYKDEYREKVLDLVERKAAGHEIVVQPEAPQPTKVPDLMAALEASLAAVRERGGDQPAPAKPSPRTEATAGAKAGGAKGGGKGSGSGGTRRKASSKA